MGDPPNIDRGTRVVKIIVGRGIEQQEFTVHRDPLCASSEFFERAFSGEFSERESQGMKLPEEEPQVFTFFVDWLYTGKVARQNWAFKIANQRWHEDFLWLKVYRMADRFLSPALQVLAYGQLTDVFSLSPTIPSRDFIFSLFSGASPLAMQRYVVEHVAYWLSKSQEKEDWGRLFVVHERFCLEMALAMMRAEAKGHALIHPSNQERFAERHGLDLRIMEARARKADDVSPKLAGKLLHRAKLISDQEPTVAGIKRSASQMLVSEATATANPPTLERPAKPATSATQARMPISRASTSTMVGTNASNRRQTSDFGPLFIGL